MISVEKYSVDYKEIWDEFVAKSKNAIFFFFRDYMDYHADRFQDSSLMIFKDKKIIALFPANINDDTVYSHQGLSYGGLLFSERSTTLETLEIFEQISTYLKALNIKKIIYKPVPYIYHQYPAQEDLYALFRLNAKRIACYMSSTIKQPHPITFSELRKRGVKKAKKNELEVVKYDAFDLFWEILSDNLGGKYDLTPVHSVEEITLLKNRFPENIEHYLVFTKEKKPVAGTVMYISDQVAHAQYIASSMEGRNIGALDFLFDHLINHVFRNKTYFDFGHSTEQMGNYLNEGLIFQKEGFGGRGIVYETFEIIL
jgi:hypothetical protein